MVSSIKQDYSFSTFIILSVCRAPAAPTVTGTSASIQNEGSRSFPFPLPTTTNPHLA